MLDGDIAWVYCIRVPLTANTFCSLSSFLLARRESRAKNNTMTNELKQKIQVASEREQNDNHLTNEEKEMLTSQIRVEENIDGEMTTEDIYNAYVID